jgi:DNA polymerase III alpha subunit
MKQDKYGQLIFNEDGILDLIMQGVDISQSNFLVQSINTDLNNLVQYKDLNISIEEFDLTNQKSWHMPDEYKNLDIAEHVLLLCNTQEELQRCGEELMMYQERDMFALLRYLKYLVHVMKENNTIWGVGRGSSVSSYVLYKLEVHKVDSMFYKLNIAEFLR